MPTIYGGGLSESLPMQLRCGRLGGEKNELSGWRLETSLVWLSRLPGAYQRQGTRAPEQAHFNMKTMLNRGSSDMIASFGSHKAKYDIAMRCGARNRRGSGRNIDAYRYVHDLY